MFQRRETGSVFLPAPREQVFELLRRDLGKAGVTATGVERIDAVRGDSRSTFVLRDAPGGTRLIHARAVRPGLRGLLSPPDTLREAVEADLFRIQRLVDLTNSH